MSEHKIIIIILSHSSAFITLLILGIIYESLILRILSYLTLLSMLSSFMILLTVTLLGEAKEIKKEDPKHFYISILTCLSLDIFVFYFVIVVTLNWLFGFNIKMDVFFFMIQWMVIIIPSTTLTVIFLSWRIKKAKKEKSNK